MSATIPAWLERNLGLLTEEEQRRLLEAKVLVCGVGGMGGVCAEALTRMGVGALVLADHDRFELTNLNRQIHADRTTLGRNKAEAAAEALLRINPELRVDVHPEGVTRDNVEALLEGVDVVVNAMDQMRSSLILERTAHGRGIPIVDAWLTPFASVFVIHPDSPHWEEFLDFPTRRRTLDELDEEVCREALRREVAYTLSHGDPYRYVTPELVEEVVSGRRERPSLLPVTWLSGIFMANEVLKLLVGLPVVDHVGVMYDQYEHRVLLHGELRGTDRGT